MARRPQRLTAAGEPMARVVFHSPFLWKPPGVNTWAIQFHADRERELTVTRAQAEAAIAAGCAHAVPVPPRDAAPDATPKETT